MTAGERMVMVASVLIGIFASMLALVAFFRGSPTANSVRPVVQEVVKEELSSGMETPYERATREVWDTLRPLYEDAGIDLPEDLQLASMSGETPESVKSVLRPLVEMLREEFKIQMGSEDPAPDPDGEGQSENEEVESSGD